MLTSAVLMPVAEVELLLLAFESGVALDTVAVLEKLALVVCSTTVNEADVPDSSVAIEQVTVPVPPTAGVMHTNEGPLVCDSDTKVVPAGRTSENDTLCASLGPLLVTTIV
jgi:hypothetical protein